MRLTETNLRQTIRKVMLELLTRRREKDPETGGTKNKDSWVKHSMSKASGADAWRYGPDDEYVEGFDEADDPSDDEEQE